MISARGPQKVGPARVWPGPCASLVQIKFLEMNGIRASVKGIVIKIRVFKLYCSNNNCEMKENLEGSVFRQVRAVHPVAHLVLTEHGTHRPRAQVTRYLLIRDDSWMLEGDAKADGK